MNNWTPASKNNKFKSGDIVIFTNRGAVPSFKVDHVEANMVFIETVNGAGKKRIVDYSASEFMLLDDWKRIHGVS